MFAQERLNAIKKIIRENRRMNFSELHEKINVSPATLRRDLTELEKLGEIVRVHGGVLDSRYLKTETTFDERLLRNHSAKKEIAKKAVSLVPLRGRVFVDAGSTCLELGKALLGRKDLKIITHSVSLIAASLYAEAEVLCIGGELRKVSGALTGGSALGALASIRVDIAFMAASGIDPQEGASTTELSEAEIKQAILSRATQKILLADHSKWKNPSTCRFAEWNFFNDWIVDSAPPLKETEYLRSWGVKIHVA